MKSSNKRLLSTFESKIGLVKNQMSVIVIYNPDFPDFERTSINAHSIIALPDNRMDPKLTAKIGQRFLRL